MTVQVGWPGRRLRRLLSLRGHIDDAHCDRDRAAGGRSPGGLGVTQNRDGFVNVAQTSGIRDQPYQMEVTSEQYHSGKPPKGTQSVVLKVFEDLGGPRPSTFYKGFNYDLDKRQPVTFDTLFAPGGKPLDAIYPIVQRELSRQTGLGAAIPPGTGLDSSHYQNFAITDDSLIFYFAPGELLPPFAGPTQAQVPRNAIPPLTV